jgi:fucose permease
VYVHARDSTLLGVREEPSLRRASVALAAVFVVFGTLGGNWDARLPAIRHQFRLDSGELGVVIFAVSVTATAVLPLAGWFSARLGSRGPSIVGLLFAAAGIGAAAFLPSFATLLPVACVIGAGWGITDVAANAHGVAIEHALGRRILSGLHSAWSFGLLAGSGIAAGAAAAGLGLRVQFPVVAAAAAVALVLAGPLLLPTTGAALDTAHFALPRGPLALPALLMFCGFFVEAATVSWAAVFLKGPVGTSSAVAAGGVAAYSLAMGLTRLVGDRLLERWGIGGLAFRSGAVTCAGLALALGTRSPVPAFVGLACVGASSAPIIPALFRLGGTVPGIASGAGIAALATAGYTGGVVNGPAIGFHARGVGLTGALGLVGAAGLVIALLGPRLGAGSGGRQTRAAPAGVPRRAGATPGGGAGRKWGE